MKSYSALGRRLPADGYGALPTTHEGHSAAHVALVSSAVVRGSSSEAEYAPNDLGKRTRFDRLRLRVRNCPVAVSSAADTSQALVLERQADQIVHLANMQPVVAQDGVRGRHVKMKIRQHKVIEIIAGA